MKNDSFHCRKLSPATAFLAALTAALLWAPALPAQETGEDEDVYVMNIFTVNSEKDHGYRKTQATTSSRIALEVLKIPMNQGIVSEEFLEDTATNNLVDAFNYMSGVSTHQAGVLGRNDGIKIRGFSVGALNTYRDGYAKPYFNNIDGVERIEVVKGAVSSFYGRADPGGLINYLTKKPKFIWQTELSATIGNYDFYKAMVDTQGKLTEGNYFGHRLVASWEDSGDWRDGITWEKKYFLGGVTWQPKGDSSLTIHADYEYSDSYRTGGTRNTMIINHDFLDDYDPNRVWSPDVFNVDDELRYVRGEELDLAGYSVAFKSAEAAGKYSDLTDMLSGTKGYFTAEQMEQVNMSDVIRALPDYAQAGENKTQLKFKANPRAGQEYERLYHPGVDKDLQPNTWPEHQPPALLHGNSDENEEIGWRTMRFWEDYQEWLQGGGGPVGSQPDYPASQTGYYFPGGKREFNANGEGSYDWDESHIASLEFRWEPLENLNLRYGLNYLENNKEQLQQYNSDVRQDGYTLSPGQGYGSSANIHGAAHNAFLNTRLTNQFDITYELELGPTKHSFFLALQWLNDQFRNYNRKTAAWLQERRWLYEEEDGSIGTVDNSLPPPPGYEQNDAPNGQATSEGHKHPGDGVVDIFYDDIPDVKKWARSIGPNDWTQSTDHNEEGYSLTYRSFFLPDEADDYDLMVLGSIRYETRTTRFTKPDDPNPNQDLDQLESGTTPLIGLNYEVYEGVNVYASYGETYQPPNRPNQGYTDPADPQYKRHIETGDIENITGKNYEAGVKVGLLDDKVHGAVSIYHVELDNLVGTDAAKMTQIRNTFDDNVEWRDPVTGEPFYKIDWKDYNNNGSADPDEWIMPAFKDESIYVNSGKETVEGVEFDLILTPMDNYQIVLAYAWTWTNDKEWDDFDKYGDPLDNLGTVRPLPQYYNWQDGYGIYQPDPEDYDHWEIAPNGFFKTSYLFDDEGLYYRLDESGNPIPDIDPHTGEAYQEPALAITYDLVLENSYSDIVKREENLNGSSNVDSLRFKDAEGNLHELGVKSVEQLALIPARDAGDGTVVRLDDMSDGIFAPGSGLPLYRADNTNERRVDAAGFYLVNEAGDMLTKQNGEAIVLGKEDAVLEKAGAMKTQDEIWEMWKNGVRMAKTYDEKNNVPEHKISIWNKYTFVEGMFENLEVGLGFYYESSALPRNHRDVGFRSDPYFVFNGMLGYKILFDNEDELKFTLNVNNLFDEEYEKGNFAIGKPREFRLTAKYKF